MNGIQFNIASRPPSSLRGHETLFVHVSFQLPGEHTVPVAVTVLVILSNILPPLSVLRGTHLHEWSARGGSALRMGTTSIPTLRETCFPENLHQVVIEPARQVTVIWKRHTLLSFCHDGDRGGSRIWKRRRRKWLGGKFLGIFRPI